MRRSLSIALRRARLFACVVATSGLLLNACGGEWRFDNGGARSGEMLLTGPTMYDHAPTPFYVDPNIPPPGLDTEWKHLLDGAGNPGPVRVRLTFVYPSPGAEIEPAPVINGFGSPGRVFHYVAEACMDPVPNPQNSPFLASAFVRAYWSVDGRGPINRIRETAVQVIHVTVPNGGCVTMKRLPPEWGGIHGQQWVFFDPPGARYLMFAARYGGDEFFAWNDAPCPPSGQVETVSSRPECILRSAHLLDYQWVEGTNSSLVSPYDGQWSGSGTGVSSASTPARVDLTFEVAEGGFTTLTVSPRIDTAPGAPQPFCSASARFGGTLINNGVFSISGGNLYHYVINGTFTSADSASGTVQVVPGTTAQPWCPGATMNWSARKGAATPAPTPAPPPSSVAVAHDDAYTMARGSVLTVPAPGVLANDSVPAGVTPSVRFVHPLVLPSNAGIGNLGGGSFRLELSGNPTFTGTVTFRYEILVGATVSNAATVTVTVN